MTLLLTIVFCLLLALGYGLLMLAYKTGWTQQKEFILPVDHIPHTRISIIIPARNEAQNIGTCIESILAQQYPPSLFELIVVDDYSEDSTAKIVERYTDKNVKCLKLADILPAKQINSYKKAALTAGINASTGELIVTTDADCIAPDYWLANLAAMYERDSPPMIVAPVTYSAKRNILPIFQLIDFMSMQGITAAAHKLNLGNMCNGANLAFSKSAFEFVGGYEDISHLASGDDYLLMMKINRAYPGRIAYLKSEQAIVATAPQLTWKSFLHQRIRWASKSGKYNDNRLTAILILVYLFNVALFGLSIAGFFTPLYWVIASTMLVIKIAAEYLFVRPVAKFFSSEWVMGYFILLQPLHVLYIVLAGFLGFFGKYEWKGRRVR